MLRRGVRGAHSARLDDKPDLNQRRAACALSFLARPGRLLTCLAGTHTHSFFLSHRATGARLADGGGDGRTKVSVCVFKTIPLPPPFSSTHSTPDGVSPFHDRGRCSVPVPCARAKLKTWRHVSHGDAHRVAADLGPFFFAASAVSSLFLRPTHTHHVSFLSFTGTDARAIPRFFFSSSSLRPSCHGRRSAPLGDSRAVTPAAHSCAHTEPSLAGGALLSMIGSWPPRPLAAGRRAGAIFKLGNHTQTPFLFTGPTHPASRRHVVGAGGERGAAAAAAAAAAATAAAAL